MISGNGDVGDADIRALASAERIFPEKDRIADIVQFIIKDDESVFFPPARTQRTKTKNDDDEHQQRRGKAEHKGDHFSDITQSISLLS